MSAPLIGLTTRNLTSPTSGLPMIASPKSYTQILMQLGAVPILIPVNLAKDYFAELIAALDGIIFTGGGDIDPARFNGEPHRRVYDVDPERDQSETALFEAVRAGSLPFMGICRGIQLINVALGGDLYTHISDQLPGALEHACFPQYPPEHRAHPVEVKPGSRLAQCLGGKYSIQVNSLHHQGIKTLAPDAIPLAWAPDGLVEAIQVPGSPFGLAVQWHPEWLPDDPNTHALFTAFIETARRHRMDRQSYRAQSELAA